MTSQNKFFVNYST